MNKKHTSPDLPNSIRLFPHISGILTVKRFQLTDPSSKKNNFIRFKGTTEDQQQQKTKMYQRCEETYQLMKDVS